MILIEFTKNFATSKKGDKLKLHPILATKLVNVRKVAKVAKAEKKTKSKD